MQNFPVQYFGSYAQYSGGDMRSCKIKRIIAESVEVAVSLSHRYLGAVGNVKVVVELSSIFSVSCLTPYLLR